MATRLSDVAARAGVSVKTVSNVINDYPHITSQTRAKVEAAIAALDYTPNVSARSLRKGRSDFIALAIPEMASPYFAELGAAISRAAKKRGITVLIDQTEGEPAAEKLVLDGMRGQLIDGIIFSPITTAPTKIGARRHGETPAPAGRTARRRHLRPRRGRLRPGVVRRDHPPDLDRPAPDRRDRCRRWRGHRRRTAQGLSQGAQGRRSAARPGAGAGRHRAITATDGAASMRALLALPEPPDAVFCFNDLLALGALRTLAEAGLSVPGDVAVVGFDDIEDGRYHSPVADDDLAGQGVARRERGRPPARADRRDR